jgi:hypothetical protein
MPAFLEILAVNPVTSPCLLQLQLQTLLLWTLLYCELCHLYGSCPSLGVPSFRKGRKGEEGRGRESESGKKGGKGQGERERERKNKSLLGGHCDTYLGVII